VCPITVLPCSSRIGTSPRPSGKEQNACPSWQIWSRSSSASTPTSTPTPPRWWPRPAAGSWPPRPSPPPRPATRPWLASPSDTPELGCGRWRAPAATAPGWPGCSPNTASGWWSWTAQHGRPAAMAPSPTRSMPPGPPARRWAAPSWPSLAPAGSGPPLACWWRPAARRWMPPAAPSGSCRPWWWRPPSGYGPSCGAAPPASWWRPAHACAATQAGSWSAGPPRSCCGRWPAGCWSWTPRPAATTRPSPRSCVPGGRTCSPSAGSARSPPRWCCAPGRILVAAAPMRPSPCSPAPLRSRPPAASGSATGLTAPGTAS
jgi:hypothetical protein